MAAVITFRTPNGIGVSPGANSTSCVIVKPSALAIGDLMIAHVGFKSATAMTGPAGWTKLRQDSTASTIVSSGLFHKIADAADVAATDFTFTGGSSRNKGVISCWYVATAGTHPEIRENNAGVSTGSVTVTISTITPEVADSELLFFCATTANYSFSAYAIATSNPASWVEEYDNAYSTYLEISVAHATRPEVTGTGNWTATVSTSSRTVGQCVVLNVVDAKHNMLSIGAGN